MQQPTVRQHTVGHLLDEELRLPRVGSLEAACAELAARPLDVTLAEIRQALEGQVGGEGRRRLHVLVSTLYHRAGASLDLTIALRTEIEAAPAAPPTKE